MSWVRIQLDTNNLFCNFFTNYLCYSNTGPTTDQTITAQKHIAENIISKASFPVWILEYSIIMVRGGTTTFGMGARKLCKWELKRGEQHKQEETRESRRVLCVVAKIRQKNKDLSQFKLENLSFPEANKCSTIILFICSKETQVTSFPTPVRHADMSPSKKKLFLLLLSSHWSWRSVCFLSDYLTGS